MQVVMDAHARVFAAQYSAIDLLEAVKGPTRETRAMRSLLEATLDGVFGDDPSVLTELKQRICLHLAAKHKREAA
jgi:ABC-type uncharacterized transport system YnjBCD ATPase subunit